MTGSAHPPGRCTRSGFPAKGASLGVAFLCCRRGHLRQWIRYQDTNHLGRLPCLAALLLARFQIRLSGVDRPAVKGKQSSRRNSLQTVPFGVYVTAASSFGEPLLVHLGCVAIALAGGRRSVRSKVGLDEAPVGDDALGDLILLGSSWVPVHGTALFCALWCCWLSSPTTDLQ